MSKVIPSKLWSMTNCKCPRCRTGNVFKAPIYSLFNFSKTYENCPHCGLHFEHETGFFWGAMYISYAFSTAFMIIFGVIGVNSNWSFSKLVSLIVVLVLLITPFSFRYSRILLLYWISPNREFKEKYL